jgi:Electron transfer DM13
MSDTVHPAPRRPAWLLLVSHLLALLVGFAAGIYALPILTAPAGPSAEQVAQASVGGVYSGAFRRDLKDSDPLHWGEGTVSVSARQIAFNGRLAPGPDYKLYLSPTFVETEADFKRLKSSMLRVGDVKSFENFIVNLPEGTDPSRFTSVIVWCETFSQFITAAQYRDPT